MWRWDQGEPFGSNTPDENPSSFGAFEFPLRFPGQYADKETGLHQNTFRDYDPSLGKYLESDPMGLRGGLNTYGYVLAAPLANVDPDGLAVNVYCRPTVTEGTGYFHCFVHVTCPAEGWSKTFSMFANWTLRSGYKAANNPADDIKKAISYGTVAPKTCMADDCGYEKAIDRRFASFPAGDVHYRLFGPNSNSFVNGLLFGNVPASVPQGLAVGINMPHPAFAR